MKWVFYICCTFFMISCSTSTGTATKSARKADVLRDVSTDLTTRLKSFAGVSIIGVRGRAKITIRGVSSIMNQDPLFILDDRPVPSYADLYNLVNSASIKRIEVLKNPIDLALYGFRGANGVIRVTTDPS